MATRYRIFIDLKNDAYQSAVGNKKETIYFYEAFFKKNIDLKDGEKVNVHRVKKM